MITNPSLTAPGDPGRLIISVDELVPASPRDRSAVSTFSREYARIASGIPGNNFCICGAVASGVTSVGEIPVPPVVTIKST